MKSKEREDARRLRKQEGRSVKEIAAILGVSVASVSIWVRDVRLTKKQRMALDNRNPVINPEFRGHPPRKPRGERSKFFEAVEGQDLSNNRKARIAEAAVLFRLALHGFEVSGSVFDGARADWLVETLKDNRVLRLQVKCVIYVKQGLPMISLRCSNGRNKFRRYAKTEFDFIVGYDLFTDTAYVFSTDEVAHLKEGVTIREDAAERWDKLLE